MILAIDVGNTNVVLGCVENGKVIGTSRMNTVRNDLPNDYAIKMRQCFELDKIDADKIEGVIMSSVVPPVTEAIKIAVKKLLGLNCLVVGSGIKTGIDIKIDDPATAGPDLITGAVGALDKFEPPIIIVDMGTATTLFAVDQNRAFCGGAIIPGVKLSFSALSSGTSLLPVISVNKAPKKVISTNTVDCMESGAIFGTAAMVDGMVDRMEEELGKPVTVVATGGLAEHIIPYCKRKIEYDADLILHGLEIIYNKNKKRK